MKNKLNASSLEQFLGKFEEGDVIERKGFNPEITVEDDKTFIAKISTLVPDMDGDVILPSGCDLTRYTSNPTLLWSHKHTEPSIGKAIDMAITDKEVVGKYKIADTPMGQDIWVLVKNGMLRACSIGFIAKNIVLPSSPKFKEIANTIKSKFGLDISKAKRIITDWLLLENSLVNIPNNPEALVMAYSNKSISLCDMLVKDFGLTDIEVKEATVVEEPKVEPKEEVKVEPIVENVVVKVDTKEEVKIEAPLKTWKVLRDGPYVPTEKIVKSISKNGFYIK